MGGAADEPKVLSDWVSEDLLGMPKLLGCFSYIDHYRQIYVTPPSENP